MAALLITAEQDRPICCIEYGKSGREGHESVSKDLNNWQQSGWVVSWKWCADNMEITPRLLVVLHTETTPAIENANAPRYGV